jgi:hypothetical protein
MLQSQVYVRGKGYVNYDPTQLSFADEIKLTNAEGWKINLHYENINVWSLALPKFDTGFVSVKNNRYLLRTKYHRVIDCVNQLVEPVVQYICKNREKLGVTKTEEELRTMLTKTLFVSRTLHPNVFIDKETHQQVDLETLKSHFRVKCYAKPVLYIRDSDIYIDFETTRATIMKNTSNKKESENKVSVSTC